MLRVLLSDIKYQKNMFISFFIILLPFYFLNMFKPDMHKYLLQIMFLTLPAIGIFSESEAIKFKKIRLYAFLPISLRQQALARWPIFLVYWTVLILLFRLSCRLSGHMALPAGFFPLLTLSSVVIILVATMTIYQDIKTEPGHHFGTAAIRWLSITFAILSGILYFLLINLSGDPAVSGHNFFLRIFFAPKGAILVFFTALVFIYLSVFVYENRTSYLS